MRTALSLCPSQVSALPRSVRAADLLWRVCSLWLRRRRGFSGVSSSWAWTWTWAVLASAWVCFSWISSARDSFFWGLSPGWLSPESGFLGWLSRGSPFLGRWWKFVVVGGVVGFLRGWRFQLRVPVWLGKLFLGRSWGRGLGWRLWRGVLRRGLRRERTILLQLLGGGGCGVGGQPLILLEGWRLRSLWEVVG